jgi:hypothetical protein
MRDPDFPDLIIKIAIMLILLTAASMLIDIRNDLRTRPSCAAIETRAA